MQYLIEIY